MHLVGRMVAILRRPQSEWQVVCREPGDPADLFVGYVAILALIPPLAGFVGDSVVGIAAPDGGTVRVPVLSGLLSAIFGYVLAFVAVSLLAALIDTLAPRFGGRRNAENALKLAAYSYTPYWLAGAFGVIPGLRFLVIIGLYGGYLMWVGLPPVMQVRQRRALPFTIAVMAFAVALALLVGGIQATMFAARGSL